MNEVQAGLTVLTVLVVPYIVQAIKSKAMAVRARHRRLGAVRRPHRHGRRHADRRVGVTDKWLDALLALGDIKED